MKALESKNRKYLDIIGKPAGDNDFAEEIEATRDAVMASKRLTQPINLDDVEKILEDTTKELQ